MTIERLLAEPARTTLVVQPIADVGRGDVVGYEALARFDLDGPVRPDRVFAQAAKEGLGPELEALVVARALELHREVPANAFFAINVDPSNLVTAPVRAALLGQPTLSGIVIELTEHRAIEELPPLSSTLEALRRNGAFIAVDDAGSGYSGLRQILQLRPQFLKLDLALVEGVHEDPAKQALIQMLGELAAHLDAWLVAEGVETAQDLRVLMQLGVPLAQGYFLAKPGPPWGELLPQAREALDAARSDHDAMGAVGVLVESCALLRDEAGWPESGVAIRVSASGRPMAMRCTVAGNVVLRGEAELMRVKAATSFGAVARRAATRPEHLRWDPLLCIDDVGNLRGVVQMSRLVNALADLEIVGDAD